MPTAPQLDWNLVRSFVAVADQGSLSRAARQLGLAHPTIARHVQQLEEALGIRLFERTASGLAINEAGARLAEVGRRMQKDASAFDAVAESLRTTRSGVVRITHSELLSDLVPELLAPLLHGDGEAQRQFEIIVSAEQLNLLEREADIALRHVRPEQSELLCRHVGNVPMGAYASRSYVERFGLPTAEDLHDHWFIDGASEQPFTMAVERLGYHVPQERVAWRTDYQYAQRRAAVAGLGIVALPAFVGEADPELVRVLHDPPPSATAAPAEVTVELWLVSRPGARQQRLLAEVGDHLAAQLQQRFGDEVVRAA
jgi:molybdate transport repressor ModE-like protein